MSLAEASTLLSVVSARGAFLLVSSGCGISKHISELLGGVAMITSSTSSADNLLVDVKVPGTLRDDREPRLTSLKLSSKGSNSAPLERLLVSSLKHSVTV